MEKMCTIVVCIVEVVDEHTGRRSQIRIYDVFALVNMGFCIARMNPVASFLLLLC
jgi:hypothetical protein